MLNTSLDLFWVAMAFAVLWIGIAIGFGFFYLAFILRNVWFISESIKKKIQAVEKVVTAFRGKVESTASYIPPLIDAATRIIETIAEKKKSSEGKTRKSRK